MKYEPGKDTYDWGVRYVEQGWSVIPVHPVKDGKCACGCDKAGKHPALTGWATQGIKSENGCRVTFQKRKMNIAILTGRTSGIIVLDIDVRDTYDGRESLKRLCQEYEELPPTRTAKTGGGGDHYFFKVEDGCPKTDFKDLGYPGVEIRGDGVCAIVAPSVHVSGRAYEWDDWDASVAPAPQWLLDLATKAKRKKRERASSQEPGEKIRDGARNQTLFRMGCSMRHHGGAVETIRGALREENRTRCSPPLKEDELEVIIRSVAGYEPTRPVVAAEVTNYSTHWVEGEEGGKKRPQHYRLDPREITERVMAITSGWPRQCNGRLFVEGEAEPRYLDATKNCSPGCTPKG